MNCRSNYTGENSLIEKSGSPLPRHSNGFRGVCEGRTLPLNFEQQNFFNPIFINYLAGQHLLPACIVDLSPPILHLIPLLYNIHDT